MCCKIVFQSDDKFIKSGDIETEKKHNIVNIEPNRAVITNIILLSKRSDKYPIGHWNKAPEIVIRDKYKEISKIEKFINAPYTAPIVNIAGCRKPVHNILTVPKGEVLYSSFILIADIFLNVGGLRFVRSIGINGIDSNKDTNIKGSYSLGLLKFNNKTPKAKQVKVITI